MIELVIKTLIISGGKMSESNTRRQQILYIGIVVAIVIALIAILCLLFNGNRTYTSDNGTSYSISVLHCEASDIDGAFFAPDNTINNKHEIKITYQQDTVNKISYTYKSDYQTTASADNVNAVLHAKYNKYMAQYDLDPMTLNPIFSVIDNKLSINLLSEVSDINTPIGVLFFLDSNEVTQITHTSLDSLSKVYTQKGFVCKIKE